METPHVCLALSTFADEVSASSIITLLLEERLIACGTMIPGARSLYRWQEKIEESGETVVLFKTVDELALRFMERLKELHPYELPEIILLRPEQVSSSYEGWVRESLRKLG
jgi:periplasmic divalent cation tolerance protein